MKAGARYSCNFTASQSGRPVPEYVWVPAPPCAHSRFNDPVVAARHLFAPACEPPAVPSQKRTHARTVWLVGDSTTMQTAFVLYCRLLAADGLSVGPWDEQLPWTDLLQLTPRDIHRGRRPVCARVQLDAGAGGPRAGAEQRLCYVPAGMKTGLSVPVVLHILVREGQMQSDDVVLCNSGAWQMGRAGPAWDTYHQALASSMLKVAASPNAPHIVWREMLAQHFSTPSGDGVFNQSRTGGCMTTPPPHKPPILTELAHDLDGRNGSAVDFAASPSRPGSEDGPDAVRPPRAMHASLTVLHLWEASAKVPLLHVGMAPLLARGLPVPSTRPRTDCTHYCNWSGMMDLVLSAFALAVAERQCQ